MSATLNQPLETTPQIVRLEPQGAAPVTLIVLSLSAVSAEAREALRLPPGPGAVITWRSFSALGHVEAGVVFLQPGEDLELALFMNGLGHMQAHACAEVLAGLLSWEEEP